MKIYFNAFMPFNLIQVDRQNSDRPNSNIQNSLSQSGPSESRSLAYILHRQNADSYYIIFTCIHTQMQAYMHTLAYVRIIYIHTYIHTY